ncbi:hypothetical protein EV359DRAFT_64562 [Lentinula novae-zelandiae]|nr:hypothetical protein EV359DRAFT_64562 [Lentinula novae-zelandiae]
MLFKASYLSIFASFLLAAYAAPSHSLPIVYIKFYFQNTDIAPPGTGSSSPQVRETVKFVTDVIRLKNGAKAEWKPQYRNRLDHDEDELSFYYWGDGRWAKGNVEFSDDVQDSGDSCDAMYSPPDGNECVRAISREGPFHPVSNLEATRSPSANVSKYNMQCWHVVVTIDVAHVRAEQLHIGDTIR